MMMMMKQRRLPETGKGDKDLLLPSKQLISESRWNHSNGKLSTWSQPLEIQSTSSLANEVNKCGQLLCEALELEPTIKENRSKAIAMNQHTDEVEVKLRQTLSEVNNQAFDMKRKCLEKESEEKDIKILCEKCKVELERYEKQLATFKNIKPAFMDEYEVLQKELQELFFFYNEKLCNLQWLENQLGKLHFRDEQKYSERHEASRCFPLCAKNDMSKVEDLSDKADVEHDVDDNSSDNIF